jgi:hypothetical protein
MEDNSNYYMPKIDVKEQPLVVEVSLNQGSFAFYLSTWI